MILMPIVICRFEKKMNFCRFSLGAFLVLFLDYPDYNSRIYSGYAEVKYEDGEEQKYRPQVRFHLYVCISH